MARHEEFEFNFWGMKGRAVGRFPVIVLAVLVIAVIAAAAPFPFDGIGSAITWVARIRGP